MTETQQRVRRVRNAYLKEFLIDNTAKERFLGKMSIDDDCWNWIAGCDGDGYGAFKYKSKNIQAYVVSFVLFYNTIPEESILHKCRNRRCVNPKHLKDGTHQENMDDRKADGMYDQSHITHCIHGHEFTPENVYTNPTNGSRRCRICSTSLIARKRYFS